jgi:hypothetical protein
MEASEKVDTAHNAKHEPSVFEGVVKNGELPVVKILVLYLRFGHITLGGIQSGLESRPATVENQGLERCHTLHALKRQLIFKFHASRRLHDDVETKTDS